MSKSTNDLSLFAIRLQSLRKKAGWSVYELARRSTVSEQAISDLEDGTRKNPRIDTAQKLAQVFGVSMDWLTGFEQKENILEK